MFLNEKKAAKLLGLSVHFLRAQRHKRPTDMISYYKIGKRVLYHLDDIQQYMSSHKIGSVR